MRGLWVAVACLGVSACALAPGMQMDEGHYESTERPGPNGKPVTYNVIPITADLIQKQAAATRPPTTSDFSASLKEQQGSWEYRVGPHDVLNVTVWDHPELTIPAGQFRAPEQAGRPVDSNGDMYFPYVGLVRVGGLTLDQIRQELTQRLSKYIEKAQLDVTVAAFRSQKVQVVGEVQSPGFIPVTDVPLTALDAVNLAKGFTEQADPADVMLVRNGVAHHLNLLALYDQGDLSQNMLLHNGDVLTVGDRSRAKVFVLGEVKKPATYFMYKDRMTLAEALGGAEGVDQLTSNPGRIYVIRGTFASPEIYKLDAASPDSLLLAVEFQLNPMDVVYVSTSDLTRWDRVIGQLAPTINMLFQASYTAQTVRNLTRQ